jgi:polyphenol oxidase
MVSRTEPPLTGAECRGTFLPMLTAALLSENPGVRHGFAGGPVGAGGPLNLGKGASPESWARAVEAMGLPEAPVALASQVHGRRVLEATGPGLVGEADALYTRTPGLCLAIRTADCVPVLVAGMGVVAAIHAGWRGVAAGVVPACIAALGDGGPWVAAIGPAISVEAYEVGEEVVAGIREAGVPSSVFVQREGDRRPRVDLRAAVAWQLRAAGVDRVEILPHCTFLEPSLHSYRRDGAASGRQAALIALC